MCSSIRVAQPPRRPCRTSRLHSRRPRDQPGNALKPASLAPPTRLARPTTIPARRWPSMRSGCRGCWPSDRDTAIPVLPPRDRTGPRAPDPNGQGPRWPHRSAVRRSTAGRRPARIGRSPRARSASRTRSAGWSSVTASTARAGGSGCARRAEQPAGCATYRLRDSPAPRPTGCAT
jgi:hypothetical protein